jgi:hypothetical protein
MRASTAGVLAGEVARFVVCLGLPYAALLTGAFAPRDVGLQGSLLPELTLGWTPDQWTRAVGQACVLAALTTGAIAILSWQVRRADGQTPGAADIGHAPVARSIRDGVYAETHWSFYRVLPVLVVSNSDWAALAGLALVAVEAALAGWLTDPFGHNRWFESILAVLSATFFAMAGGNLWVAVALQIGVRVAATRIVRVQRGSDPSNEIVV